MMDVDTGDPRSASEDAHLLEAVFRHWILGRARPDVVLIDPDGGSTLHLEQVLTRLRGSATTLDPACARRLGLPDGVSIAAAAHQLLFARHHPDGPRCRSFRSASYYLYGLARITSSGEEFDRPSRPRNLRTTTEPSAWISGASDGQRREPDPAGQDRHGVREQAGR